MFKWVQMGSCYYFKIDPRKEQTPNKGV